MRQLFLIVEFQLITVKGMTDIENHHVAGPRVIIVAGKNY